MTSHTHRRYRHMAWPVLLHTGIIAIGWPLRKTAHRAHRIPISVDVILHCWRTWWRYREHVDSAGARSDLSPRPLSIIY